MFLLRPPPDLHLTSAGKSVYRATSATSTAAGRRRGSLDRMRLRMRVPPCDAGLSERKDRRQRSASELRMLDTMPGLTGGSAGALVILL